MTVLALDWNASRIRAVLGGTAPSPVALEPPYLELPLAIALDTGDIGVAAQARSRTDAHLICQSFLPYLTDKPGQGPRWQKLDAHGACERIWRRLQSLASDATAVVLTVPDYLRPVQVDALRRLGEKLRLPIVGALPLSLAGALAAKLLALTSEETCWTRSVLVVDVDEHALTIGWVKAIGEKAQLSESRSFPHLGWRVWKERLIDGVADQFVLEHRRDPRDVPQAEQSLFDQLELLSGAVLENRPLQLAVRGREWLKHMLVHPEQAVQFCWPLVQKVAAEAEQMLRSWPMTEWPPAIVMTRAAGRLPGVLDALQTLPIANPSAETRLPQIKATRYDEADFGVNLLIEEPTVNVCVLRPEEPAQAAHSLAEAFRIGAVPARHLETLIPIPLGRDAEGIASVGVASNRAPRRVAAKR